ncbi:MAG: RcnB family protein [Proteobacteria bacterium]|nr:RcnB family protein [Pseudomonadota bacterium]MBU1420536.1 RcnB family protein [Pseudomonadota bacterium]MBU1456099.1 RcnB family protein [Pseudomonadota bacterium]
MKKLTIKKNCFLALVIAGMFVFTGSAFAEKPSWAGGSGKGGKHEQKKKHYSNGDRDDGYSQDRQGYDVNVNIYFGDQHRNLIRNYYTEQYRSGHCPPGLAKKNSGCMPPGQARKWQVGRPLPRDVIFHDLPSALVVQLGPPPAGHRFVRVASDILLITVGTGMIVDAIQDLNEIR